MKQQQPKHRSQHRLCQEYPRGTKCSYICWGSMLYVAIKQQSNVIGVITVIGSLHSLWGIPLLFRLFFIIFCSNILRGSSLFNSRGFRNWGGGWWGKESPPSECSDGVSKQFPLLSDREGRNKGSYGGWINPSLIWPFTYYAKYRLIYMFFSALAPPNSGDDYLWIW